jgi:hypothetical protein
LIGTAARTAVVAGTAQKVAGGVAMRQREAAEEAAHKRRSKPAAGLLTDEIVDQLKKLAELRDVGVLTEKEFAARKAKLLP